MPTPTITEASPASASSSATSSAVAEVSTRSGRSPSRSRCSSGRRSPRSTRTTTSRRGAQRGGRRAGRRRGCRATTTSGVCPASRSTSAPRSTPIRTGRRSRTNARDPLQLGCGGPGPRRRRPPGRPASRVAPVGRPSPWSSSASSRRRNSLLLWVKVSSWVARPLRACAISCVERARRRPPGRGRRARRRRRPSRRGRGPWRRRGRAADPRAGRPSGAGLGQQRRAERGVAAGEERRDVEHRHDPGVDAAPGRSRGRGRAWSRTAMSPGRSRGSRTLVRRSTRTVPVEPGLRGRTCCGLAPAS